MNKEFALDLIKLLSSLESWGMGCGKTPPDYLLESIADAVEKLSKEVLRDKGVEK